MARLVPVEAEPGPAFIASLQRIWDAGDAVFPVDPRLPRPARSALLDAMRAGDPAEDGDAVVVATSGTTGTPKGVVLTHAALAASARMTSSRLAVDVHRDRWLARLPLAHIGGLSVVVRALLTRTPLTFEEGDGATLVSLVPTLANRMDLTSFRAVLVGGSADWRDRPPNVICTYGMTETGSGVVYDGSPLHGVEVREGAGGELHIRGPMLLRCYRDGTDPKGADGWFPTGDAGRVLPDGRVEVVGRMAEVIVTGGEKVWPAVVETVLRAHPAVDDAAVAGAPDDEWGERVVAYVVSRDQADRPTLDALRGHVKEQLPAWCAPHQLVLVDDLPRSSLGKLDRSRLSRRGVAQR